MKRWFAFFIAFLLVLTCVSAEVDGGDTAFVGMSAVLVMLMTPALGFFYAGLVRKKNLVSTLVQCIAIFAVVSIVWAVVAYSMAFGPSIGGVIGDFSYIGLRGVGASPGSYGDTIPHLLFFFFQLKFAAITPALIIGAFAERISFKSLLLFILFWTILVYAPIAHWVWNTGGWLAGIGAIDFAGGTVVHIAAGMSALAAAFVIGRRKGHGTTEFKPNNIPFVILGTALLWFGWFGFNAGSALTSNGIAVSALVTTNLAAAAAALSWMFTDWFSKGKPSGTGIAIGAVCGLVAITPASGFVGPMSAIFIGMVAGIVSNLIANLRARTRLDDSLDVFACHGVSGIWGALATGLFAQTAINSGAPNGLLFGNPGLLLAQVVAIIVVGVYAFAGSWILLKILNRFIRVRVSELDEEQGLDRSQHGEEAYN